MPVTLLEFGSHLPWPDRDRPLHSTASSAPAHCPGTTIFVGPWRIKIGTSTCFNSLIAEVYNLKTQLSQRTDFSCALIQKYMANEAKKSVVPKSSEVAEDTFDMPLE
ncbi:hypothetical protein B0J13DRAFT_576070 [Dactylonectria estremocensis]|uniref:Uncharacterized protein n=1 Tax=Dactylonectria estremocensis TaxID=1079267 RepID=A0A9P9I8Z9_9HYPO|nr:hypothetical protein B0J13DRAFT_576070 [Dactylonectria estremocensis]